MSASQPSDSVNLGASTTQPVAHPSGEEQMAETVDPSAEEQTTVEIEGEKKKKSKVSAVWNDVTEVEKDGVAYVKCNHCDVKMMKTKGGPTTTYKRHIDLCVVRKSKLSGKGTGGMQQLLSFDSSGSGSLVSYKYDKEAILNMTTKMIDTSKEDSCSHSDNIQPSSDGGSEKRSNEWRLGFEVWVKRSASKKPSRRELDVYLDDEGVLTGEGDDFDVLRWWRLNLLKFPILSRMARDILSIPVTIVPSESAFSAGRRVIGDDRCSLGDDTVE